MEADHVVTWAKRLTAVAAALGVLWAALSWAQKLATAVELAHENRQTLERIETAQALTYCELRDILPADCELPE